MPNLLRWAASTMPALSRAIRARPHLGVAGTASAQLACGSLVYLLDLPTTSAENFFALEDQAEAQGARLVDWNVRLAVINREHWGEVTFEKIDSPSTLEP